MVYYVTKQSLISSQDSKFTCCSLSYALDYFEGRPMVQVDTETEGHFNFVNRILLLQLGCLEDQFVINFQELSSEERREISRRILNNPQKKKLLQNAKFDIKFFWFHDMDICNVYDVMLAEVLLNAGIKREKGFFALDSMCARYTNIRLNKELRGRINHSGIDSVVIQYAADDVKALELIREAQLNRLRAIHMAGDDDQDMYTTTGLEMQNVIVFAHMEYNGIKLDLTKWEMVRKTINDLVVKARGELDRIVHEEPRLRMYRYTYQDLFTEATPTSLVNWNSSVQKLKVLKKLFPDITSSGAREVSRYKQVHPLAKALLEYNKANKLKTGFGDAMPKFINPKTGRIHTEFWQIKDTGRIGSANPNMLNIPSRTDIGKMMRACFVAEKGYKMVGGDYSGCELRIIAEASGDPVWVNAFKEGKDLHSELCAMTFDIPIDKVNSATSFKSDLTYRSLQKCVNFGLAYGMSAYKLADTIETSVEVAEAIINKFFSVVPGVERFLTMLGELAKSRGFIRTLKPYGRIRFFDNWQNKQNFKLQSSIERKGKNHPIQGCNADMIKLAQLLIFKYIKENNLPVKIILQVYDELQTEVAENFAEEWFKIMPKLMIQAAEVILKTVPMEVDCRISGQWGKFPLQPLRYMPFT